MISKLTFLKRDPTVAKSPDDFIDLIRGDFPTHFHVNTRYYPVHVRRYWGPQEEKLKNIWTEYEKSHDYMTDHWGLRNIDCSNEFDIAAFGDSVTFGDGMPYNKIWPTLLEYQINKKVKNFGVSGCSNDAIADLFDYASACFNFKIAIINLTSQYRFQILRTTNPANINETLYARRSVMSNSDESWIPLVMTSLPDEFYIYNTFQAIRRIQQTAKLRGIFVLFTSWVKELYRNILIHMNIKLLPLFDANSYPFCRDRAHPGEECHSNWILESIPVIKYAIASQGDQVQ